MVKRVRVKIATTVMKRMTTLAATIAQMLFAAMAFYAPISRLEKPGLRFAMTATRLTTTLV
jgi:hypothetical protein